MAETKTKLPPKRKRSCLVSLAPLLRNVLTCATLTFLLGSCSADDNIELPSSENNSSETLDLIEFSAGPKTSTVKHSFIDAGIAVSIEVSTEFRTNANYPSDSNNDSNFNSNTNPFASINSIDSNNDTAFNDIQSRAQLTDIESLQDGFGIFAYTSDKSYSSEEFEANFMYNQKVSNQGGTWKYTPLKYWNSTSKLTSFVAYAPYQPLSSSSMLTFVDPQENPTVSHPSLRYNLPNNVGSQIDLVYASAIDKDGIGQKKVNLNFEHALSRVAFSAREDLTAEQISNGLSIRVDRISVESIGENPLYTSGVLALDTGEWTELGTEESSFVLTEENFNFTTLTQTPALITNNESYLMLIPQRSPYENFPSRADADLCGSTGSNSNISSCNKSRSTYTPPTPLDWKIIVESTIVYPDGTEYENNVYAVCSDVILTQGYGYEFALRIGVNSLYVTINEGDWNHIDQNEWFVPRAYQDRFHLKVVIPNMGRDDAVYKVKSLYDTAADMELLKQVKTLGVGESELREEDINIPQLIQRNPCNLILENDHGQTWSIPIRYVHGYMRMRVKIDSEATDIDKMYVLPLGRGEQPSTLLVDWGDGTWSNEIFTLTDENNYHVYPGTGIYSIYIYTSQNDFTQPQITYFVNGVTNANRSEIPPEAPYYTTDASSYLNKMPLKLYSLNTPLLRFAQNVHSTLTNCSNMQTVDQNIYSYNSQLSDVSYAFMDCKSIERVPPLWNYAQFTRHVHTFLRCTPRNQSSIPQSWR